jgi:hypothetical protein
MNKCQHCAYWTAHQRGPSSDPALQWGICGAQHTKLFVEVDAVIMNGALIWARMDFGCPEWEPRGNELQHDSRKGMARSEAAQA